MNKPIQAFLGIGIQENIFFTIVKENNDIMQSDNSGSISPAVKGLQKQ